MGHTELDDAIVHTLPLSVFQPLNVLTSGNIDVIVQEPCTLGCVRNFGLFRRQRKPQLFLEKYRQVLLEPLCVLPVSNNPNQEVIGVADILQGLIS